MTVSADQPDKATALSGAAVANLCFPCQDGHPEGYPCWGGWNEDDDGIYVGSEEDRWDWIEGERVEKELHFVECECDACQPVCAEPRCHQVGNRHKGRHWLISDDDVSAAPADVPNGPIGPESATS